MRIQGITVAVLVEQETLKGRDFDELCTALLLTIANQTGEQVTKEEAQ
jgi:predicted metal-binding membrane protein